METFLIIMLVLPILIFVLPGGTNWSQEIPKLVVWYLIFGTWYINAYG